MGSLLDFFNASVFFLQTLSKGGESSLSGPQQYVAVQRPALPLQEGKMTRLLVHLNLGVLKTRLATRRLVDGQFHSVAVTKVSRHRHGHEKVPSHRSSRWSFFLQQ